MSAGVSLTVVPSSEVASGRAILVLPGLACLPEDFAAVCLALRSSAGAIAVARYPGSDASYRPDRHPTVEELVEGLIEALEVVWRVPVIVVGHSFGGLLGQLLAERRPEAVVGLLSYEGNLAGEDCLFTRRVAAQAREAFTATGHASLIAALAESRIPAEQWYAGRVRQMSAAAYHAYSRDIVARSDRGGLLHRLARLACPVAYMHGERTVPPAYITTLTGMGCEIGILQGAGHFPFVENPVGFAQAIVRFAARAHTPTRSRPPHLRSGST